MTKKLGVLLVDVPEPTHHRYYVYLFGGIYGIEIIEEGDQIPQYIIRCTQEEAKKYPQFRWVALEDLHDQ